MTMLQLDEALTPFRIQETVGVDPLLQSTARVPAPVGAAVVARLKDAVRQIPDLVVVDETVRGAQPRQVVDVTHPQVELCLSLPLDAPQYGWEITGSASWPGSRYRALRDCWQPLLHRSPSAQQVAEEFRQAYRRLLEIPRCRAGLVNWADVRAWLSVTDQAAEAVAEAAARAGRWEHLLRVPVVELDRAVRPVYEAAHPVAARTED